MWPVCSSSAICKRVLCVCAWPRVIKNALYSQSVREKDNSMKEGYDRDCDYYDHYHYHYHYHYYYCYYYCYW